jgi:hypothetical protein
MIPEALTTWINASVNKHFDALRQSIPLWIEGTDINIRNQDKYAELRITGLRYKNLHEILKSEVDINIMCSVKMNTSNSYDIHKVVGIFQAAMTDIAVGDYPDSDYIGCLKLRNDVPRSIDIVPWGMVDTESRLLQTSIEAFYSMET